MTNTPDILKTILAKKEEEVARRKIQTPIEMLQDIATNVEKPRGFYNALHRKATLKQPAIIAEIKKASPSQGVIREDFKPVMIAQDYAMNGATCLSILTDKTFFRPNVSGFVMVAPNAVTFMVTLPEPTNEGFKSSSFKGCIIESKS